MASNHVSYYDPFAVGTGINQKIHYMAKNELFEENKIQGLIISLMAGFPVKRGTVDMGAIKKSLEILKSGDALGIFPEGTRSQDGSVQEGHLGTAMIALQAKVPIIPAAVVGTLNARKKGGIIPRFNQFRVLYGDPIDPQSFTGTKKEKQAKITETLITAIRNLKEELESQA